MKFSLEQMEVTTGKTFVDVEAYGGTVTLASLDSVQLLDWMDSSPDKEDQSPEAARIRREAGLRLLVLSLVDGETHAPVPEADLDKWLDIFRKKDSRENAKVIREALKLNDLEIVRPKGSATSDASPTDSPSK